MFADVNQFHAGAMPGEGHRVSKHVSGLYFCFIAWSKWTANNANLVASSRIQRNDLGLLWTGSFREMMMIRHK